MKVKRRLRGQEEDKLEVPRAKRCLIGFSLGTLKPRIKRSSVFLLSLLFIFSNLFSKTTQRRPIRLYSVWKIVIKVSLNMHPRVLFGQRNEGVGRTREHQVDAEDNHVRTLASFEASGYLR